MQELSHTWSINNTIQLWIEKNSNYLAIIQAWHWPGCTRWHPWCTSAGIPCCASDPSRSWSRETPRTCPCGTEAQTECGQLKNKIYWIKRSEDKVCWVVTLALALTACGRNLLVVSAQHRVLWVCLCRVLDRRRNDDTVKSLAGASSIVTAQVWLHNRRNFNLNI